MGVKHILYISGIWILFAVLAIINAVIRETVYAPKIGDHPGHILSTIIFITMISIVSYLFFGKTSIFYNQTDLIIIGVIWVVMTVAFEFLAGHYVFGNPWEDLIADYNILKGRIWITVLITLGIAPYLFGHVIE